MDGNDLLGQDTVLGEDGTAAFVGAPWRIVGVADFGGFGHHADILWHNSETHETQIWLMDQNKVIGRGTVVGDGGSPVFIGPPWRIVGAGDYNGNGLADILWHNSETNEVQIWFMEQEKLKGRATVLGEDLKPALVGFPFSIVGAGDFDSSDTADVLWHNSDTHETQIWFMERNKVAARGTVLGEDGSATFIGPPFNIVAAGDFNGDGIGDILWHNSDTHETQIWFMDSNRIAARETVLGEDGSAVFIGPPWSIVAVGDFDLDGNADILWHHADTNETQTWFMKGSRLASRGTVLGEDGGAVFVGSPWDIVGAGPFG